MKQGIHPTYDPEATVICSCGNTWHTGSTVEVIHTDVCSNCHPFYTGEQRIVDAEGQVDRFYRKLEAREEFLQEVRVREESRTSPEIAIAELELGKRAETALANVGILKVGQALERLALGDENLLAVDGFDGFELAQRVVRERRTGTSTGLSKSV